MASQDFSRSRLRRLLTTPGVELRHDVDFIPDCALQMAELEHQLGVSSTYYVRADRDEYDVTDSDVFDVFQMICEYGHTLGVHVDLGMGRDAQVADEYLRLCCEQDFLSLSLVFPQVVRKVSLHAPPAAALWRNIPGFDHAGSPEWFGHYVADSRGWFPMDPERMTTPYMLGTHPEWWFLDEQAAQDMRVLEAAKP